MYAKHGRTDLCDLRVSNINTRDIYKFNAKSKDFIFQKHETYFNKMQKIQKFRKKLHFNIIKVILTRVVIKTRNKYIEHILHILRLYSIKHE